MAMSMRIDTRDAVDDAEIIRLLGTIANSFKGGASQRAWGREGGSAWSSVGSAGGMANPIQQAAQMTQSVQVLGREMKKTTGASITLGKSIKLTLLGLVMTSLGGLLEVLEPIAVVFEVLTAILGPALLPITMALMDVFLKLAPVLEDIMTALQPVIDHMVVLIGILDPAIALLAVLGNLLAVFAPILEILNPFWEALAWLLEKVMAPLNHLVAALEGLDRIFAEFDFGFLDNFIIGLKEALELLDFSDPIRVVYDKIDEAVRDMIGYFGDKIDEAIEELMDVG
jgi:hypothetical protein